MDTLCPSAGAAALELTEFTDPSILREPSHALFKGRSKTKLKLSLLLSIWKKQDRPFHPFCDHGPLLVEGVHVDKNGYLSGVVV